MQILKDLWELGLKCNYIEGTNADDIQEQWLDLHATHFVILKESEPGVVRIRCWESDRFHEQKINTSELVNTMKHKLKTRSDSTSDQYTTINNYSRSESKTSCNEKCEHNHENNNVNILFVTEHDNKLSANNRRRYDSQASC